MADVARRFHPPRAAAACILLLIIFCTAIDAGGKFAYVAIHYEGTPADGNYVLGLRVVIQSLKPLQHPFLVLVSDSVSEETRVTLTNDGATIIPVQNIENPFSHVLARFQYTFNKLHLWNMTEYDRLIYLDADNIVTNRDMINELFHCGHFCVVFMNPCHFHTGLMVIKPDQSMFSRMLAKLRETGSYDGADQGFLSAFFEAAAVAPVFNPRKGPSESPMNVLHISYNMHSLYFLGQGGFGRFRCGVFRDADDALPVASLGYPVPIVIKPWFWYTGFIGHAAPWAAIRAQLDEPEQLPAFLIRLVAITAACALAWRIIAPRFPNEPAASALHRRMLALGVVRCGAALGIVLWLATARIGLALVPAIMRPEYATVLFCATQLSFFLLASRIAACALFLHRPVDVPGAWQLRAITLAMIFGFAFRITHPLFTAMVGHGIQVVVLHGVLGVVAMAAAHVAVVMGVAAGSPLQRMERFGDKHIFH